MENLRIPGPTPCPDEVLQAMTKQMINHRGLEFRDILDRATENLKVFFQTKNDLFLLTGSGTGGMEAAVVNTLSPGDSVLSVSIGVFGDRFATIAEQYGAAVTRLTFEWSKAADPDEVGRALQADPKIKAVLVTHNETSTGVTNDLAATSPFVAHRKAGCPRRVWLWSASARRRGRHTPMPKCRVSTGTLPGQRAIWSEGRHPGRRLFPSCMP